MGLLINACVAFTGFYVISKIYHSPLFSSWRSRDFIIGILAGLLGLFLIYVAVEVEGDGIVRVDLRHLPLVLLAYYGAGLPLFIATIFIGASRFLFGAIDHAVVAFIGTIIISLGMIWIYKRFANRLFIQSMILNVWALTITSVVIFINLDGRAQFIDVLLALWTVGLAISLLSSILTIDLEKTKSRAKEYKFSAERDHLTGLYNRRMWDRQTASLKNDGHAYNVLALDIDHFKRVNDTYGHANGDLVLKQFADILLEETRPHDLVARIGGEEFMILVNHLSPAKAEKVAQRIRSRIENSYFELDEGPPIRVTSSIGISHGAAISIQVMTEAADKALYEAKANGRNQVVVQDMNQSNRSST